MPEELLDKQTLQMMFSKAVQNANEEIMRNYEGRPLLQSHMKEGIAVFRKEFAKLYAHRTGKPFETRLDWSKDA